MLHLTNETIETILHKARSVSVNPITPQGAIAEYIAKNQFSPSYKQKLYFEDGKGNIYFMCPEENPAYQCFVEVEAGKKGAVIDISRMPEIHYLSADSALQHLKHLKKLEDQRIKYYANMFYALFPVLNAAMNLFCESDFLKQYLSENSMFPEFSVQFKKWLHNHSIQAADLIPEPSSDREKAEAYFLSLYCGEDLKKKEQDVKALRRSDPFWDEFFSILDDEKQLRGAAIQQMCQRVILQNRKSRLLSYICFN